MLVRRAVIDDAPGIASVIHAMPELAIGNHQPLSKLTEVVGSNLVTGLSTDRSSIHVAEIETRIVGYIACHWVAFLLLDGGGGYVSELFVHPNFASQGIGTELLRLIEAEARSRGCTRLSLLNGRDRKSYELGFYSKLGWTEREHMRNFIFPLTASAPSLAPEGPTGQPSHDN